MIGCNLFKGKNRWQSKLKCANVISKNILLVSSLNIYISLNWLFLGIQKIPRYRVWAIPRYNQPYLQKHKGRCEYMSLSSPPGKPFYTEWLWNRRRLPWRQSGKESTCPCGRCASVPGSGRSPGEGHGNPFQYPCLGNPMGREACQATVQRVARSLDMTKHKIKVLKPI